MNQTVRFTEIIAPPAGTRQPWRLKDGNGVIFKTFNPQVARQIQSQTDQSWQINYEAKARDGYPDDLIIGSAVVARAPEARPAASGGGGFRPEDPEVSRRIANMNALTNAVAYANKNETPTEILEDAARFADWIFAYRPQAAPKNSGKPTEGEVQELFPGAERIGPRRAAQ